MQKFIPGIVVLLFLAGCATVDQKISEPIVVPEMQVELPVEQVIIPVQPSEKETVEIKEEVEKAPEILKGIIFGKTNFEGVLKDRAIRIVVENINNKALRFEFQIQEPSKKQILPWNVRHLDPGYFFVELPEGQYKISKVSILVGTTLATENINVSLNVVANKVVYLGTLNIDGTKERIKLGGLPVIQPGFEYAAKVVNEHENAMSILNQNFPELKDGVVPQLMAIVSDD